LALESVLAELCAIRLPFLVQLCLCVAWASCFALAYRCSSRLASLLRLDAGARVANLSPLVLRPSGAPPAVLYDRHRDPGCRVLREALCMLDIDFEVRPVPVAPDAGARKDQRSEEEHERPWKTQLEEELAAEGSSSAAASHSAGVPAPPSSLPLPHLSGIPGLPLPHELQGRGFALLAALLAHFVADPKGDPSVFPLDLDEKAATTLANLASRVRHGEPWGEKVCAIDWTKLRRAMTAAMVSPSSRRPFPRDVRDLAPLVVFGHEGSSSCRPLFELLHSLQLRYVLRVCAQGSPTRARIVLHLGSLFQLPVMHDPNTGQSSLGSADALRYLRTTYAGDAAADDEDGQKT